MRQWEERCSDLRDLVAGHEGRCKEAAAEVMKGNEIIEKLQVNDTWCSSRHSSHGVAGCLANKQVPTSLCKVARKLDGTWHLGASSKHVASQPLCSTCGSSTFSMALVAACQYAAALP